MEGMQWKKTMTNNSNTNNNNNNNKIIAEGEEE
jgi:hypothetical protein